MVRGHLAFGHVYLEKGRVPSFGPVSVDQIGIRILPKC